MIGNGASVPKAFCFPSQFGCTADVPQFAYDPVAAKPGCWRRPAIRTGCRSRLQAFRSRDWDRRRRRVELAAARFKPQIDFLPYAAGQQRLSRNEMQLYLQDNGWFSINDVYAVVNPYFNGDAYDSTQDATLTGWVRDAAKITDPAQRKEIYAKVLKRVAEQVFILPMWTHPNVHAYSADLDMTPYSDENPRFYLARWKQ